MTIGSETPFQPTHVVPAGGLSAWLQPDAATAPAATLDTHLPVQLLLWWGSWAKVLCSNGWVAWVDGRLLQPGNQPSGAQAGDYSANPAPGYAAPPAAGYPANPSTGYSANPQAGYAANPQAGYATNPAAGYGAPPATGYSASPAGYPSPPAAGYSQNPTGGYPPPPTGSGYTPAPNVRIIPGAGPGAGRLGALSAALAVTPLVLVGVGLVIVGSFLNWVSGSPTSISAWDISLNWLITGTGRLSGIKAGLALLATALVGLPLVTRKPLPKFVPGLLGALAAVIAILAWIRIGNLGGLLDSNLGPGLGVVVTLVGGALMFIGPMLPARKRH